MAKIEDFYHAPAEERANPRQRECPDCGALLIRRTSERMSPLYQEINYQCQNFFCASTFKGYEEIVYRLKVPMQPNPMVSLPVSPSQRYAEPLPLGASKDTKGCCPECGERLRKQLIPTNDPFQYVVSVECSQHHCSWAASAITDLKPVAKAKSPA